MPAQPRVRAMTKSDEPVPSLARLSSGIGGLDDILRGGFLEGGVYILQGSPGAGKTVLANEICFRHAAQGGRAAYVTLLAEMHTRLLQHLRPMAFFDESVIPESLYYVSAFQTLEGDGLKGLIDVLRREIKGQKADLLVVDGLVAAQESAPSDREFKKFINELQAHASASGCTVLLLTSGMLRHVSAEHTMVDGVFELEDQLFEFRTERSLIVRKFRGSGFLRGRHSFRITDEGVKFFPRVEAVFASASQADILSDAKISVGIPGIRQDVARWFARRHDHRPDRGQRHRQDDLGAAFSVARLGRGAGPVVWFLRDSRAPVPEGAASGPGDGQGGGSGRCGVAVAAPARERAR